MRYTRVGFAMPQGSGSHGGVELLRCGDCYALIANYDVHDHDAWHTDQARLDPEPFGWSGMGDDFETFDARLTGIEQRLDAAREALT